MPPKKKKKNNMPLKRQTKKKSDNSGSSSTVMETQPGGATASATCTAKQVKKENGEEGEKADSTDGHVHGWMIVKRRDRLKSQRSSMHRLPVNDMHSNLKRTVEKKGIKFLEYSKRENKQFHKYRERNQFYKDFKRENKQFHKYRERNQFYKDFKREYKQFHKYNEINQFHKDFKRENKQFHKNRERNQFYKDFKRENKQFHKYRERNQFYKEFKRENKQFHKYRERNQFYKDFKRENKQFHKYRERNQFYKEFKRENKQFHKYRERNQFYKDFKRENKQFHKYREINQFHKDFKRENKQFHKYRERNQFYKDFKRETKFHKYRERNQFYKDFKRETKFHKYRERNQFYKDFKRENKQFQKYREINQFHKDFKRDNKQFHKYRENNHVHDYRKINFMKKRGINYITSVEDGDSYQEAPNLREENFGKIQKSFSEVHGVKKLLKRGESVCKVIIEGFQNITGTGFVLFDNFILTNAHLFDGCVEGEQLMERTNVFVRFNYEDPELHIDYHDIKVASLKIYCRPRDYAILELASEGQKPNTTIQTMNIEAPPGLLKDFGPLPPHGEACIIGHPAGEVKQMDFTCIIEKEKRGQAVNYHLDTLQGNKFDVSRIWDIIKNQGIDKIMLDGEKAENVATYHTFMHHGSSGSPVFDAQCRVFGLHTGGFVYRFQNHTDSVIEYAQSVLTIIEDFVRRLKERGDEELLKTVEKAAQGNPDLKKVLKSLVNEEPEEPQEPSDGDSAEPMETD